MINGVTNPLSPATVTGASSTAGTDSANKSSFADVLKDSIGDVAKMQQDASQAVQDLAVGKTEDVTGVMTAVEKSDLAFKTLLTIRSKLMDAYDEIKGMQI